MGVKIEAVKSRLKRLAEQSSNKKVLVETVLQEITAARRNGATMKEILAALNEEGAKLSLKTFSTYLKELCPEEFNKKKKKRKAKKAAVTEAVAVETQKTEATVAETTAQTSNNDLEDDEYQPRKVRSEV
jgi:predicted transcriptional regulator